MLMLSVELKESAERVEFGHEIKQVSLLFYNEVIEYNIVLDGVVTNYFCDRKPYVLAFASGSVLPDSCMNAV